MGYYEDNQNEGKSIYSPLTATSDNDTIVMKSDFNSDFEINAGAGDDSIYFGGRGASRNKIDAGEGNDTIGFFGDNSANQNTIDGGDGDDYIIFDGGEQMAQLNVINAGAGDDTIVVNNYMRATTIDAGSGYDLIVFNSFAPENSIIGFEAGDSIQVPIESFTWSNYSITYSGGSVVDNDYIVYVTTKDTKYNSPDEVREAFRIAGVGSNIKYQETEDGVGIYFYPIGNYYSINGSEATKLDHGSVSTEYDDTIYAENLSTNIDAGDGSDIISVMSGSGIIDGGSGADNIYLGTMEVTIAGSGDVESLGDGDWLIGEDTIHGVGSDYTITSAGEGLYSLAHFGNHFSIDGSRVTKIEYGTIATQWNDTIYAENLSTSIDAREGSDIISIMSGAGTVDGGSGADDIYLGSGAIVTIVGEGSVVNLGDGNWQIGEDTIHGIGSNATITSAGENLYHILEFTANDDSVVSTVISAADSTDDYLAPPVEDYAVGTQSVGSSIDISWRELGLAIGTNRVQGESISTDSANSVTINEDGEMVAVEDSNESDAVIEIDSETNSANLVINGSSDRKYNLTFHGGTVVGKWNATMSSGRDDLHIGNILGGHFDGGDGKDYFHVTKNLQGNVTLTGGATNEDLESGNNFYTESSTVASSSSQNKITITDVNFNASDVILIDAGVENLTADFFGDSRFYNYSSAFDASTSGVYAGTIFDASDLVKNLGMSFSMLRMADKSRVTLDDENSIDESLITNVIWANSDSATIDFFSTQTDSVLIFTNTNSRGDIVSLGGDFDDTIHAGASDTIDAGGGDDLIYLNRRNHVVFGNSEGNDTIYGWDSTDTLDLSEIPDVSISSDGLYLENDNGTLLIEGSFTNSTNIRYNDGIMRVGDSNGEVIYNKNVTYYAGSTLVINSSSNNTIDLSSSTYENISNIDASNASGRDTFRYTSDAGDVTISNGDSKDIVDLSSYSVDEVSAEFTDSGLVITIDDSNLNIVGTNLTTFSLSGGKYTADFNNQTLS